MLLNKLESGFLLLETQQGFVAVEPSSFWQRVYLLWTFRNFHELSPLLLNARQTALINDLFLEHATVISHEYEPGLQIGVVENFVPAAIEIGAALGAKTNASPAVKAKLPEQTAGQYVAPAGFPIEAAHAMKADLLPAVKNEEAEREGTGIDRAEIAPRKSLDGYFAPSISWPIISPIISWLRPASSNRASPNPASPNLAESRPAAARPQVLRIVTSSFAAAAGALLLYVCCIVAFHRTGAVPGSQAHSSPPQINSQDSPSASPDSPSAPQPTSVPEDPATVPEVTPQADAGPDTAVEPAPEPTSDAENPATVPEVSPQAEVVPDAAVEPAPAKVASPKVATSTTTTHRTMAPERASRGATARVASRSSGGSRAGVSSRVPASTSTRRMTLAPASRGAMTRSAQSYFDLAKQQMRKGNYAAAEANYKRAWRIEENSAAAKGRLVRARRAMQAENEGIANPR